MPYAWPPVPAAICALVMAGPVLTAPAVPVRLKVCLVVAFALSVILTV